MIAGLAPELADRDVSSARQVIGSKARGPLGVTIELNLLERIRPVNIIYKILFSGD
jgi:hypothetical protein